MNVNKVFLGGNLTRDIELRTHTTGFTVGSFGIAVNRKWTDKDGNKKEEVTFVDCDVFNKAAEIMAQYLYKGDPVFLIGRLKLDQWEDKVTGDKRSKLKMVVDEFQFVPRSNAEPRQEPQPPPAAPAKTTAVQPELDEEEDVPF